MNPLVSIIMPAYNVEKYIRESIDSILVQTYENWELLICDDGSSDGTLALAQSYVDQRIKVFANPTNLGNLVTTNFLFSKCIGEFITIQDADDWSALNRLEIQINHFLKNPKIGMLGTNYMLVNENKSPIYCGFPPLSNEEIKLVMQKEVIPTLYATVMLRSEIVKKAGDFRLFFNRRGYADFDWLARCAEHCIVENLKEVLYFYRKHNNSFTHNYPNDLFKPFMPELIVRAHKYRLNGGKDYFIKPDIKAIKNEIAAINLKMAKSNFWNGDKKQALSLLKKAFLFNPFNFEVIKDYIYILRH